VYGSPAAQVVVQVDISGLRSAQYCLVRVQIGNFAGAAHGAHVSNSPDDLIHLAF